ncbi:ankyrin repeat domain-containing protein [Parashewanella curva]|uniref:Ankyrin repeat domain-containing protein n=1 Tax=Parashewanella curva TaxID=2338552 RepID=A0A3L8PST2_9GAMM|nr:ankyrin repeat domain-containing protein [Parashewanella curva]RLV58416.1 ankyrin repeat domain-containing protein [Parashewanella curva]
MGITPITANPYGEHVKNQRKPDQEQYLIDKEGVKELLRSGAIMTMAEFKASEEFKNFSREYRLQKEAIKQHIQQSLTQCSDDERVVMSIFLDRFLLNALDNSNKRFSVFSDDELQEHIYTRVKDDFGEFVGILNQSSEELNNQDIMRAMILLLPERDNGSAWISYCTQVAVQCLKKSQENARQLANAQAKEAEHSALLVAIEENKFDVACSLLSHSSAKLPVTDTDEHQRNVLHLASMKGQADLAELILVKKAPSINPLALDDKGNTALHWAVSSGSIETVNVLLATLGDQMFKPNHNGETPIHTAAKQPNSMVMQQLLDVATVKDVNQQNKQGNNAAHVAVIANNPQVYRMLVGAGANPRISNHQNQSVFDLVMNLQQSFGRVDKG